MKKFSESTGHKDFEGNDGRKNNLSSIDFSILFVYTS